MSALRREIEDLTAEIAADEAALAEIASAALPEVTPALLAFHRERVSEAQANVGKIRDALEAARGELQAIEATPGPAADLRRQLEAALAGLALGTTTQDEVDALEVSLTEAESISTITGTKAKRIKATITGLEDRLTSITPALEVKAKAKDGHPASVLPTNLWVTFSVSFLRSDSIAVSSPFTRHRAAHRGDRIVSDCIVLVF